MPLSESRWIQRYRHFQQAFTQLDRAVQLAQTRALSELEAQGLIQAFEYTHELAWKVLKDFLSEQGHQQLYGSKDSSRTAFRVGLIANGEVWMEMITSRNLSRHTYDQQIAEQIMQQVIHDYHPAFQQLITTLAQRIALEEPNDPTQTSDD